MICMRCKTTESNTSGRCAKCGREMTPMMGKPFEALDLSKQALVVPFDTVLHAFSERVMNLEVMEDDK